MTTQPKPGDVLTQDSGWIEWMGGENPVPGQIVDVRFRNGDDFYGQERPSKDYAWEHDHHPPSDIIAYRVSRPSPEGSGSEGLGPLQASPSVPNVESSAANVTGWQPIETAPRDGTWIIAVVGGADGRWEHLNGRAFVIHHTGKTSSDYDLGWSLYPGLGGISDFWFSAWMPLPLPPVIDAGPDTLGGYGAEGGVNP